jgi:transcriptional regulator with XRE-family HTH domain
MMPLHRERMAQVQENATQPTMDIGARLKAVRTSRRLSQRELARKSGVTNGLISQIEQNHSSPSVSSLKRILDAIPLSLSDFFAQEFEGEQRIFFRAAELRELNPQKVFRRAAGQGGISLRQVGDNSDQALQMLHERYEPGADTGIEKYSHNSEEAGIVISGRIEVTVGDRVAELHAGDAYLFDSRIPHRFRNIGDETCVLVSACTPPSF